MKYKIKTPRNADELMRDNMLVKHYAGSISYGTNLPTSDVDLRGVFCADPVNILTPWYVVKECGDETEEDTKLYELRHFMKLCLDCNPNILETLWVCDNDIVFRTPAYDLLRENRSRLLSSKVAFTFSGYAISQLRRIKSHKKWLNNPQPEQPPVPKDFVSLIQNFSDAKIMPGNFKLARDNHRLVHYGSELYGVYKETTYKTYDDSGSLNTNFEGNRHDLGVPVMIIRFNKDEYKLAKENHRKYWEWKKNRNRVRTELEAKYQIDTKHAMHLIRLLKMCEEILTTGEVIVKRPDAQELLDIRHGKWTYDEVLKFSEDKDKYIREVLYKKTDLRRNPDIKFAAGLLMEVQELVWER